MEAKQAIRAIERRIVKLDSVRDPDEFYKWQKSTASTLENIYPQESPTIKRFLSISTLLIRGNISTDDTSSAKLTAKDYLESIISDIQDFGIIKSTTESKVGGVNVNVNQSNTQNQSTNVNIDLNIILDVLKGGLRDYEFEELKEILKSKDEPKEKKKKFFDKIKSFGADVSSNILANLLTNPMIYEQLGKMF